MNYKLCKKLKDVGFPQRRGCSSCLQGYAFDFKVVPHEEAFGDDYVSLPTLSELIEECGDRFASLMKSNTNWIAISINGINEIGPTPEESVANLWLALNKKK